jgi:ribonuclease III
MIAKFLQIHSPYRQLEKKLGYSFRRMRFLETALMHPSFRFETKDADADNQRLEFLGDSVLNFVSAEYLFKRFPDLDEGAMTSLRSRLTSGEALAKVAARLEFGKYLKLGKGELKTGGQNRASNLADGLEALIAAAYLDGGMKAVVGIFQRLFVPVFDISPGDNWADNPKGELQQITQNAWNTNPSYCLVSQEGPSHDKRFTIEVRIKGKPFGRMVAASRRDAERRAAAETIALLRKTGAIE